MENAAVLRSALTPLTALSRFNLFSRFCTISASYYPLYYYITIPWYSWDRSRQQLRTVSPGPAQARQRTSETTLNSHGAPPDPIMPLSMSPIPSPQEPRVISRCTSKGDSFPSYTTSMKSDLYAHPADSLAPHASWSPRLMQYRGGPNPAR